jgi:hypothetical protein
MKSSHLPRYLFLTGLLVLTTAACDGDDPADLSTTTSVISGGTSSGDASTTTTVSAGEGSAPSTTLVGQTVDSYEIVARESDSAGETIYVVVPPGDYTDVDMENFVLDLVESGTATFGAEVFDDGAAVEAYRKPEAERTPEETESIGLHHFVSLQNGTTLVFRGPFESSGEMVIGS